MKRDLTIYYADPELRAEVIRRLGDLVIRTKEAPEKENAERQITYIQLRKINKC